MDIPLTLLFLHTEDDLLEELPTDNDLTSMYTITPAAKRKPVELPPQEEVIPETPSPCKTKTSQRIVADKLLEKAKSPKKSPLRRKNIFAVKGRKNWDRRAHLKETDRVTSRQVF